MLPLFVFLKTRFETPLLFQELLLEKVNLGENYYCGNHLDFVSNNLYFDGATRALQFTLSVELKLYEASLVFAEIC